MPNRSPARYLAPLALLAVVVTIYLVARPELGGSSDSSGSTAASTTPRSTGASARNVSKNSGKAAGSKKTYTVKPGDVLGSISEATGVSQLDLIDINDLDDAQSLRVGQKLKLAP